MVRRFLAILGVGLVLTGSLLLAGMDLDVSRFYPVQVPFPVGAGSAALQTLVPFDADIYSIVLDVEPSPEQWEEIMGSGSMLLHPDTPLRVSYTVCDGERIVAQGARIESPSISFLGVAPYGLLVASFHGEPGHTYMIDVRIDDPAPDYGLAETSLVVAASLDRRESLMGANMVRALLSLVAFAAGATLLLVLFLNRVLSGRRVREAPRRRRSVTLDPGRDAESDDREKRGP